MIHRFCETFSRGENVEAVLRRSFDEVVRRRRAEIADRLVEIESDAAIAELLPLAQNYLASGVFERIERARSLLSEPSTSADGPNSGAGLWSELGFRLRRPLGILSGAIDKLLITTAANGKGFDIEIIDFKTNRLRGGAREGGRDARAPSEEVESLPEQASRRRSQNKIEQFAFDFKVPQEKPTTIASAEFSLDDQVRIAASDYQLQMQAYALAVRELIAPTTNESSVITSTLHFLDPNVEFHLTADLLAPDVCRRAIDDAMLQIVSSGEPHEFPVHPASHCRMCSFLGICPAGREFVRSAPGHRMSAVVGR